MAKVLYTAKAKVTGGRDEGHAVTEDGGLDLQIRVPESLGGPGGGTNPEELFAAGFGSCFESSIKIVARRKKLDAGDVEADSAVSILPDGKGGFVLGVRLDVRLPSIDDLEQARDVVATTHKVCPYSNATRGNIDVDITVNGEPLE